MNLVDIGLAIFCSFLLMAIVFHDFDARVFLLFVFCLGVGEIFVQVRWRMGVMCPHCGFDPVLYNRNADAAAEKVRLHLEKRRADPNSLLARPLNIPYRRVPADSAHGPSAASRPPPAL